MLTSSVVRAGSSVKSRRKPPTHSWLFVTTEIVILNGFPNSPNQPSRTTSRLTTVTSVVLPKCLATAKLYFFGCWVLHFVEGAVAAVTGRAQGSFVVIPSLHDIGASEMHAASISSWLGNPC